MNVGFAPFEVQTIPTSWELPTAAPAGSIPDVATITASEVSSTSAAIVERLIDRVIGMPLSVAALTQITVP